MKDMLNENLVFILEKQNSILESKKSGDSGEYILEGIAAVFQKENNNNRIYEESEYIPHLGYLKEKIAQNRLVGELDHPEKFDVSLKNISHLITDLDHDKKNKTIKIKVKLLDTPAGQIAKKLVDAGVPLSISSRAAGNVGPDKRVEIKKIFTYDLVADPGFQNAQLERVYESSAFSNDIEFEKFISRSSFVNDLECINESLGLKNDSSTKIYKVENNEEFNKLVNNTEKNKKATMENAKNEFVTADELNQYSIFLKKEMDTMKGSLEELRNKSLELKESNDSGESLEIEDRVAKLEKYSDYLAENLESAISYGEYLAENLDKSITYSKYLAENLDKSISYSKYLAENVDKGISYTEYVAENVDKTIEYTKYVAEKLDQNIQYSEYLAENLDNNIEYSNYLAENVDDSIQYSEYVAENLDKSISYSEYVAENLANSIDYSEYLAENVNKSISYSEYLAESLNKNIDSTEKLNERVNRNISYSEYIAESLNKEFGNENQSQSLHESINVTGRTNQLNSGFAGNYDNLSNQIDNLINSVKTQKTEINEAKKPNNLLAETQKAQEVLNENEGTNNFTSGFKFIDEMPEEYAPVWESLNEGHKQSIIAQSHFYKLETPYQIRNFWTTRQLGVQNIGLQKINENETNDEKGSPVINNGYSNGYLEMISKSLESRFKN
jgi:hypothetical protein